MATLYPTAKDDGTTLPNPTALSPRNAPSLAGLQDNQNDAVIAVQNKLGTGASVAASGKLLRGTGAGASAWDKDAPTGTIVGTTDSQVLTNKTLTSPTINTPVINNATITADVYAGYSASTTGTIYGIPVTAGTIPNLSVGNLTVTSGFTLNTQGTTSDWNLSAVAVNSVTYNGNRSYTLTYASTAAGFLAPGSRIRTTRSVAAPTQCTNLNGTTQYYSRASANVNGMTFTDTFTVMAWVKLTSYASATIFSRYSTTGWALQISSAGVINIYGKGTNDRNYSAYQSLPLNKWVHVAASMQMSTGTAVLYIDGVVVPGALSGTGGTSITQAGDINVGALNGSSYFPGKIAQAAVFSAVLTGATIRSYIAQGLSGSETSLVSAYSFNGVITDSNANANNLTAQGSAVATNADSPFSQSASGVPGGSYDYGLVMSVSTTTVVVQVPEGNTIPTTGGVSASHYSGLKAPFNMPISTIRWEITTLVKVDLTQSSPVQNTWYNLTTTSGTSGGFVLNIPIGDWTYGYEAGIYVANATNAPNGQVTLSTANNTESDSRLTSSVASGITGANAYNITKFKAENRLSLLSATAYYYNVKSTSAAATSINVRGSIDGAQFIYALPGNL